MALYSPILMITWIVGLVLIGWFITWLWRLNSKVQRKYLKWASRIILGVLTAAIVILLGILFFGTCLGIGYGGCM